MRVDYTIYHERKPIRVGITIPPTPSLSSYELLGLIEQLQAIRREMLIHEQEA